MGQSEFYLLVGRNIKLGVIQWTRRYLPCYKALSLSTWCLVLISACWHTYIAIFLWLCRYVRQACSYDQRYERHRTREILLSYDCCASRVAHLEPLPWWYIATSYTQLHQRSGVLGNTWLTTVYENLCWHYQVPSVISWWSVQLGKEGFVCTIKHSLSYSHRVNTLVNIRTVILLQSNY